MGMSAILKFQDDHQEKFNFIIFTTFEPHGGCIVIFNSIQLFIFH